MTRPTIAIVTSCHNYGRYLSEWADSILAQEAGLPDCVAIVDNGSTDTSPHDIEAAAAKLEAAGIPVATERIPFCNFGKARNAAVALSATLTDPPTEWVQHLDADDTLMPHALGDFRKLAPNADVVGFGYVRTGNRKAGPKNASKTYRTHQGDATRKSTAPASGVSPFRRKLWEAAPYREDMRGGWDTAFWISCSWQDARFVPTKRPVFEYRQHADSVFNTRRISTRRSKFVGIKLGNLRKPIQGVSVVIPWAESSPERAAALEWVRRRYEALHPSWEIVIAEDTSRGPWNKGYAVMEGVQRSRGVVTVVADADCIVPPEALEEAVEMVATMAAPWVVPHTLVHRLDRDSTAAVLETDPTEPVDLGAHKVHRAPYEGFAGGGIVVVDRSDYEASSGIPICFQGWGAEDEALAVILDTLVGPHERLPHDLVHLWHPPNRTDAKRHSANNRKILKILRGLRTNADAMYEYTQHLARGGSPTGMKRPGGVMMRAIIGHERAGKWIAQGDFFYATDEEARREQARGRKVAARVNGDARAVLR